MTKESIILASSSPRRIEIMNNHGIKPIIIKPTVEETLPDSIGMEQSVMFLALKKALSVESAVLGKDYSGGEFDCQLENVDNSHPYIIAADTIVYKNGIIGKPMDKADARRILTLLRGEPHFVATGVAIIRAGLPSRKVFCELTKVFFKGYSDEEIEAYISTDEPYDKAGGYAIQGAFGKYVDHIEGNYSNVMGFPWSRIEENLK